MTGFGVYLHPDRAGHGTHQELGLPPCPSVLLFNRPCPGCGLTTSWTAFIHGDFAFAFHAHPLGPITYLAFTAAAWLALYGLIKGQRVRTEEPRLSWTMMAGALVFFAFGIWRMATTPHYQTPQEAAYAAFALRS